MNPKLSTINSQFSIIICNPFDNLPEEGSKEQRYSLLAHELAMMGHNVTWFTADFSHAKKAKRRSPDGELLPQSYTRPDGVKMQLVKTPPYQSNVSFARIKSHKAFADEWLRQTSQLVEEGMPKPDYIIISTPPLSTFKAAKAMRDMWHSKVVLDIMDAWPEAFTELLPKNKIVRSLAAPFFAIPKRMANEAMSSADVITAISDNYLKRASSSSAPKANFYHTCKETILPKKSTGNEPLRLLYIGNMGHLYDLTTAVKAVSELIKEGANITLDLAGSGKDEEKLRSLAVGVKAIRFHGYAGEKELYTLLSESHAGIIPLKPSSMVAVPYNLPDYASHGLAILSTLDGECNELIKSYGAGITYKTGDKEALKEAILRLAGNRDLLQAMRENSYRLANEKFLASNIYPAFARFILST